MNRLELVAETLRAALNALATVAPAWLQALAPLAWYERYGKRIEDTRLPQGQANRDAYAQMVGEDGFALLDALEAPETPEAPPGVTDDHHPAADLAAPLRAGHGRGDSAKPPGERPASASSATGSCPRRRRGSNPPMIRRRAIARNATRWTAGTWCMSARRVSPLRPTCSRRCTRPPPV